MTKEDSLKREIKFLNNIGITYVPFMDTKPIGMLFDEDVLVGYILEDEMGDLKTQISSERINANYSVSAWDCNVIQRHIILSKNGKVYDIYNLETENSDYLDITECGTGVGYSMEFSQNKISCGKSDTFQNILLNGELYKGRIERINKIIERFREVLPELMDNYFNKYIDEAKSKILL